MSVLLFVIIVTLLMLGVNKPSVKPVATVRPFSHHDLVIRQSKMLEAYADFVNDCDDDFIFI